MKHAYLIIAHKVDLMLITLLKMLDDKRNDIYLHMDKKNKTFTQSSLPNMRYSNLFLTDRISVNWGGYSQIKCEMLLFKTAALNGPYVYYHLLSGQDLPIKTQNIIQDYFNNNNGKEFIRFQQPSFDNFDRVCYYHFFQELRGRGDKRTLMSIIEGISLAIQRRLGIQRNKNIIFYKGTNWASVTNDFVMELLRHESWIKNTFRYTSCCDEVYKQTFAMQYGFAEKLFDRNFDDNCTAIQRLIDWKRGNPYIWTKDDMEEIASSKMMFARKFDEKKDKEIIFFVERQYHKSSY